MSNQDYYSSHSSGNAYSHNSNQPQWSPSPQQGFSNQAYPPNNQQYTAPAGAPPGHLPPRRVDDEAGLPQGQERSEQMETLQSYEANARQTEDDVNQATLQREFPSIDSSLIAAIYSDSKSLSATREMLHELSSA